MNEFDDKQGVDFTDTNYPCKAVLFRGKFESKDETATHYGFAQEYSVLKAAGATYILKAGMYFAVPGAIEMDGGSGVIITRLNYKGLFSIGGPIEPLGRLRYIDGCTDTLLINPPRLGDPCLNHLHFPPGIQQTMHTHPSVRIGIVTKGKGRCVTPDGEYPLVPGVGWFLPVESAHCFYTDDESMDVIAWHPDSDTGPSDEDHPMLNRTYVEGESARFLSAIRSGASVKIAA